VSPAKLDSTESTRESKVTYPAALIGLGFVGAGDKLAGDRIGQQVKNLDGTHLEALRRNERIELVCGSDRLADRRARFTERTGLPAYAEWTELLEREPPAIVSIATNSPAHAEITIACAEAGVQAVYCEKPMATRLVDAERMLTACEGSGTRLIINHNRRFNPNYRRLRELIADGSLGELTSCNLQWGMGRLGNVGTHLFDAVAMIARQEIVAVSGTLDTAGLPDCRGPEYHDPGGWGCLRLSNGLMVTVDGADKARLPARITINGTQGRAHTGGGDVTVTFTEGGEEYWPSTRPEITSMDVAVQEIVAALDADGPSPYPPEIPLGILEAIVAFHVSSENNAVWIPLPLPAEHRNREIRIG